MVFGLSRNPEKYEQRALAYEQKGNTKKALKNREKAQQLRAHHAQSTGGTLSAGSVPVVVTGAPVVATGAPVVRPVRTFQTYETNALKWEQRNNLAKAQKNREKAWRLNNPQYANNTLAPQFYDNGRFLGYTGSHVNVISTSTTSAHSVTAPVVVETHVRPVIVEETTRAEKIIQVQPVIHREVEAPHVKVIEKHIYETVPSAGPHTITNAAIVEETIKPKVIEEIQPVVHRNVAVPVVEHVEQHITEHKVLPTVTTKEVIQDKTVHVAGNVGVAAGAPVAATTTTTTTTTTGHKH